MFGFPPHGIDHRLAAAHFRKRQFHIGRHIQAGKLALQFRAVLFVAAGAGFPVKCKRDGVKNGGFAGSGIPRDQKKVLLRFCKIDDGLLTIRPESLHR